MKRGESLVHRIRGWRHSDPLDGQRLQFREHVDGEGHAVDGQGGILVSDSPSHRQLDDGGEMLQKGHRALHERANVLLMSLVNRLDEQTAQTRELREEGLRGFGECITLDDGYAYTEAL